ncbi:hypothetical protein ACWFMI_15445 [Nocardiopsis terrae]
MIASAASFCSSSRSAREMPLRSTNVVGKLDHPVVLASVLILLWPQS